MAPTEQKKCTAKHTAYNPTAEEFRCPKCNAEAGVFAIDEPADGADESCDRIHAKDGLYCYDCKYATSGGAFARAKMKAANLVTCQTCRGHGVVNGNPAGGEGA